MGSIGSSGERLAAYVTGLRVTEVCTDLTTFVRGRPLDDDAGALLRFENGARGTLWASQVAAGEENGLSLRVYGDKASLSWRQEEPNTLIVRRISKPAEVRRTAGNYLYKQTANNVRLSFGRPEGYIEALANIYNSFTDALCRLLDGKKVDEDGVDYPTVRFGLEGVAFVEAAVKSAGSSEKWVALQ
jgi:predicted dehydrogenase